MLFDLILLFLNFGLFMLSFVFIILDIRNYSENKYKDLGTNKLPKWSSYSLACGLLALILAVIISF
jgi:hypothetical protein